MSSDRLDLLPALFAGEHLPLFKAIINLSETNSWCALVSGGYEFYNTVIFFMSDHFLVTIKCIFFII